MSINVKHLKKRAEGRWPEIINFLAPKFKKAIKATPSHVPCPMHESKKDGFRCFPNFPQTGGGVCNTCGKFTDGIALLMKANGWSFKQAIKEIEHFLNKINFKPNTKSIDPITPDRPLRVNHSLVRLMDRIIDKALPFNHSKAGLGRRYISNRGINIEFLPERLLFHPKLDYYENGVLVGKFPCLIGVVTDAEDNIVSLLRIYIAKGGVKATVPNPKKLMPAVYDGALSGSAIRLCPATDHVALAEGIETALAVFQTSGIPAWATISAIFMESVIIPEAISKVSIFYDVDRSGRGEKAAKKLRGRLIQEGKTVELVRPPLVLAPEGKSVDWLDAINAGLS